MDVSPYRWKVVNFFDNIFPKFCPGPLPSDLGANTHRELLAIKCITRSIK